MRLFGVFVVSLVMVLPAPGVARASDAAGGEPEQVYFETTISKDGTTISRPQALVMAGKRADLGLRQRASGGPRLGLRYVVDAPSGAEMTATVAAFLDGREVATGTLQLGDAADGVVTLDGGGYTFRCHAARLSAELIKRRRAERR